jgi:hypothetical protein
VKWQRKSSSNELCRHPILFLLFTASLSRKSGAVVAELVERVPILHKDAAHVKSSAMQEKSGYTRVDAT